MLIAKQSPEVCRDGEESACNGRDPGPIPGSGRFSGEGNDNPVFLPEEFH